MKTIKINTATYDIRTLYKRAKTSAQRALLGYMVKTGIVSNNIYCGAFDMLRSIERCMDDGEIYRLFPVENSSVVTKIIDITQSALDGEYNSFSFSTKEIDSIIKCMENI